MSDTPSNDSRFGERFEAVIALANNQMARDTPTAVATSAAYASARLAAWAALVNTDTPAQMDARKSQAFDSFMAGYRAMLEEHWDEFRNNYDRYKQIKPGAITR